MKKFFESSWVRINIQIIKEATWPDIMEIIDASPLSQIIDELLKLIYRVIKMLEYVHYSGKFLTLISVTMMILDAIKYVRNYYSDSAFDNMFISENVRQLWWRKGYMDLTPLRYWEMNEGYKVKKSPKCTKREFYQTFRNLIPTLVFLVVTLIVIFTDVLLTSAIKYIKGLDDLTISFGGVMQNFTKDLELHFPAYNVSVNICLAAPSYTSQNVYVIISLVLSVVCMSCILEVYFSRIRSRMCDFFYPDKAEERADYLHYKLHIGRINRKYRLVLIVRRELERRDKLLDFTPFLRYWNYFKKRIGRNKESTFVCAGCGWRLKRVQAKEISFYSGEYFIKDMICTNCHLDV